MSETSSFSRHSDDTALSRSIYDSLEHSARESHEFNGTHGQKVCEINGNYQAEAKWRSVRKTIMTASWWSDVCTVSQCKAEHKSLVRGPRRSGPASVLPFLHTRLPGHTCILSHYI